MKMYDLGFPTDAIVIVKNLYEEATTQVKRPLGGYSTNPIPIERGTIQGDTLTPFLFLLFMEPLLRWLHVGGRGYTHSCIQNQSMAYTHLHNNINCAAFADDLLCPTGNLTNLKIQALKLTLYSDWASLNVSGSKTKVTGKLNAHASKNSSVTRMRPCVAHLGTIGHPHMPCGPRHIYQESLPELHCYNSDHRPVTADLPHIDQVPC